MALNVEQLAAELEEALATEVGDAELERVAGVHERAVTYYAGRRAEARKRGRAEIAGLEAERRRLKEAFEADMRRLDSEVAAAKASMASALAAAERLAAVSRAALELLA